MADRGELRHRATAGGASVDLFASARSGPSPRPGAFSNPTSPGDGDGGFAAAAFGAGWRCDESDAATRQLTDSLASASLSTDPWPASAADGGDTTALEALALLGRSLGSALSAASDGATSSQLNGWPDRIQSDPFSQHNQNDMGIIHHSLGQQQQQQREVIGSSRVLSKFDLQADSVLSAAAQLIRSDNQLSRHSSDSGNSSGTREPASLLGLPFCSTCDDTSVSAPYQCVECNDCLCYSCACAHRRVRLTREHTVLPVSSRCAGRCRLHQASYTMVCSTCQLPLCYACAMDHADHSLDTLDGAAAMAQQRTRSTQQEAQAFLSALVEARHRAVAVAELVRKRSARAQLEAAAAGDRLRAALAAWQSRLEKKASAVCQVKVARLHAQAEQLEQVRGRVLQLLEQLSGGGAGDSDAERIVRGLTADHQLRLMMTQAQLPPVEDAAVRYAPAPSASVETLIRAAGTIETAGCGTQSQLLEASTVPVVGRPYQLLVQVRDHYGDERCGGDDRVQARVVTPDRRLLTCNVEHLTGGRYRAAYIARTAGEHTFSVTVNGAQLSQSPWTRRAVSPRRLSSLGGVRLTIGCEGTEPGQLCRPWGVAFGGDGRLVVSDRSNHRIQVFSSDGCLMLSFGGPGAKNGELNRPAGVTVDSNGRIIVADKDNHRVCVFSASGEFLLKFGDKGSRLGLFNYPWDVAVNGLDQVAVSDTRNHRVQLFSPDGLLLKKFSQDGADWKELDSPRGLCFHPDGKLYITDFNNHRIVSLDPETGKMTYLCREGTEPGRLLRPQGIAADDEGRLYVADCRNSRVQILTSSGECLMQLGEHGSGPGQFDQPQGVAIGPSGQLAVVCLENHRVQLF